MTKPKSQTHPAKLAFFAGAAALTALIPQARADSGVDALLNKLEQKGILSVDEAKELKAENDKESAADINRALNSKFPSPDWVTSYQLYGDFRGRFDDETADIPSFGTATPSGTSGNTIPKGANNNDRFRYRLRMGLTVNMKDNLQVGARIASADSSNSTGGNPVSDTSTFQGNASKKNVYVDAAYGKWTAINDGTWKLATTLGKMDLPFEASPMVFDPDYTPEGAALQATYKMNDDNSFAFNTGGFLLDQTTSKSPYLYGGQAIWNSTWTPKISTSLGLGAYDIANDSSFPSVTSISANGYTPYDSNLGNTLTPVTIPTYPATTPGYRLASHFNPVVVSSSVTYTLDSFPLYQGAFPIKLAGEYMDNPAAANNNIGWWAGATIGKAARKGQWDISYRYQYLEADAWWDQIVDDDNTAAFPNYNLGTPPSLPAGQITGTVAGGTNIKGHLIKFDYMIFDSLTFSFTAYINELINTPAPVSGVQTGVVHAMADLMWKF